MMVIEMGVCLYLFHKFLMLCRCTIKLLLHQMHLHFLHVSSGSTPTSIRLFLVWEEF